MQSWRKNKNKEHFINQKITVFPYLKLYASILGTGNFCRQLKTFANSLDPYQDRRSVGPDMDQKSLTL